MALTLRLTAFKSRSRGSAVNVYICQGSLMSTATRPLLHSSVDNRFMYTRLSIFAKLCRDHRGSWRASDIDLVFWLIHIFRNGSPIRLSLDEVEGFTPIHHRPFRQHCMNTAWTRNSCHYPRRLSNVGCLQTFAWFVTLRFQKTCVRIGSFWHSSFKEEVDFLPYMSPYRLALPP